MRNTEKKSDIELNVSEKKEELDLKIKNRFSWLIFISVLIIAIGTVYAFVFQGLKINFITLVTLIIAFFSMYLSSLFYFKTTEQSNKFYDRSFNHTRQIEVLLSSMEGKFNKSLEVLEKGNETIREKIEDGKGLEYLGEANSDIKVIDQKKEDILEDELFSKLKLSQEEKEKIKKDLHELEKEKSLLQYQINELLEETSLKNESPGFYFEFLDEPTKQVYENKKLRTNFPNIISKFISTIGSNNIMSMSDEKLRNHLRKEILKPLNKYENNKSVILNTLINIGFVSEKTNDISNGLLRYVRKEAKANLRK